MERETALQLVKPQLTEHRYQHTLGVMETAIVLAKAYGADVKKAELAAIFHDYAKFRPKEEMREIILSQGFPADLLDYNAELWHAPAGAYLAKTEAGISDPEILSAIRYHTSGKARMSLLEKIIYLADYIEPGRHFPGVDEVRGMAAENLDRALLKSVQNTIMFLMKKNQPVYPETFHTYNDLIRNGRID
ncbi:bis(5'-nucleosyl)-tetraphosphatase (symmetrical) YqeK [Neobacillus niacini]|uniref:bis(5'-nucleosyl)-tetraphosphatase (symmetrical) YqeK n=1 Tax=Neobacillus niacini TaxID=86668 RepID=UPI0021CAE5AE|nr:bis(5'-nucleosyl)-tetraphosphatase (symmetrical) YqeK [Neobacillus niacini]MCM3765357.1 bis(5'-nucleosyl)-tetraphosphatase (symmetrical) YqeK [Neobacillus niacini]